MSSLYYIILKNFFFSIAFPAWRTIIIVGI